MIMALTESKSLWPAPFRTCMGEPGISASPQHEEGGHHVWNRDKEVAGILINQFKNTGSH
jgi:hypothetical protein